MLDYEKLKRVHELMSNLIGYYLIHEVSAIPKFYLRPYGGPRKDEQIFSRVEEFLEALEAMNKPKPKFQPGEKAWYFAALPTGLTIKNDRVKYSEYESASNDQSNYYVVYIDGSYIHEDYAFKSKRELIEHYWEFFYQQLQQQLQGELNV